MPVLSAGLAAGAEAARSKGSPCSPDPAAQRAGSAGSRGTAGLESGQSRPPAEAGAPEQVAREGVPAL